MTHSAHLIGADWTEGQGQTFQSYDPATGEELWQAKAASAEQVKAAVMAARSAFGAWARRTFEERAEILTRYAGLLDTNKNALAQTISKENGKPLWDALGEVTAMVGKIAISIEAYHARTPTRVEGEGNNRTALRHRPHGVLAVFGPYNFPGHLANGHIVPALLAGNTIVFKPSELTPQTGERMCHFLLEAGVPEGAINLVQGGAETGQALAQNPDLDGLLFTGSAKVGQLLHKQFGGQTEKILALELGGNNPLIVGEISDNKAAALVTIQSSFFTSGQRCTCARRLIVPSGARGEVFLETLQEEMARIRVGAWNDEETPFMGPVINMDAAKMVLTAQDQLLAKGGQALVATQALREGLPFLSPGLIDVTDVPDLEDREIFGPLLQVIRSDSLESAIEIGNKTRFGLAAGLLSDRSSDWDLFRENCRAGIVNWNKPLTGASSRAPFGGIGLSGNHRPSAYYAADYCAWPMASMEAPEIEAPALQGLRS
ncbi:MAG: succinylglutamate-semialdehyde dehydrogenase [Alphaproteobacteria bacterium]|nr:MAG: succinylglutamate-semialdehyde dehydrogenase [Alphaproteobacteria bacterium]